MLPECKALVTLRYVASSCSIWRRKCDSGPCHASLCCRSVDGHPLPIDELKGIKPVESIDLSGKGLNIASAIIIGACIAGNAHLRELKCAQLFKLGGSVIAGHVTLLKPLDVLTCTHSLIAWPIMASATVATCRA